MSIADRIIAQLKHGPATCASIGRNTNIAVRTVSTIMNKLAQNNVVWRVGQEPTRYGNVAYVFALKEHRTVLLDDYWPMPVSLPVGEPGVTHRGL